MSIHDSVLGDEAFWHASDADIFQLSVIAAALGVGRNLVYRIPVCPILIRGRKFYRKGEILDWALTDAGATLLRVLRHKSHSPPRYGEELEVRIKQHRSNSAARTQRNPLAKQKSMLYQELRRCHWQLCCAKWPESEETRCLREHSVATYHQLWQLLKHPPEHAWAQELVDDGYLPPNSYQEWWLIVNARLRQKFHQQMWEAFGLNFVRSPDVAKDEM